MGSKKGKKLKFKFRPIYIVYLAVVILIIAYFLTKKEDKKNGRDKHKIDAKINVDQNKLFDEWGFPPSRSQMKVTAPTFSIEKANTKLFQLGLTAEDLSPIDWREKVYLSKIINQFSCGNCWAAAATSVLTDRFIIQKDIDGDKPLELELVTATQCVSNNEGCNGGFPDQAGMYFERVGVPETGESCKTYNQYCTGEVVRKKVMKNGKQVEIDEVQCNIPNCGNIKNFCNQRPIYKAKKGSTTSLTVTTNGRIDPDKTIMNIKRDLLDGPVVACFFVPKDFMAGGVRSYVWARTKGIYVRGFYNEDLDKVSSPILKESLDVKNNSKGVGQWGEFLGEGQQHAAHAVSIVGWGVGDAGPAGSKVPYWIVRNSWGELWGEKGYCKIAFGTYEVNGQKPNKEMYFDVSTIINGQTFGGCISFDPDISTGSGDARSEEEIKNLKKNDTIKPISPLTGAGGVISTYWPVILGFILILFVMFRGGSSGKKKK